MKPPVLNFPPVQLRFKTNAKNGLQVFDIIRKKFVDLTPEEWVRQHLVHFLIQQKNVPASLISIEKQLILNATKRRTDVVVYNTNLKPMLVIECKAPFVPIDQQTINQVLRYNLELQVPFIGLSNGLTHTCLQLSPNEPIIFHDFPAFSELLKN